VCEVEVKEGNFKEVGEVNKGAAVLGCKEYNLPCQAVKIASNQDWREPLVVQRAVNYGDGVKPKIQQFISPLSLFGVQF